MIYRTAHRATYRNLNDNLGSLSYRIAQLTNQIASERRINTASDDPSGAAKVLSTRSTLANINQYKTNIAVSDAWLADSGNAAQSIKETLDEIFVKTEQGATDTYNATQRGIIATEISLLFQSLIQYGDTKIGDSYIFGGQKVTTQPFSLQVEAQKVTMGCNNSDKWGGKVVNYGDAAFNNRPDLPIHSQDFLVEVVQGGGVDSRYYANTSEFATGFLSGPGYDFTFNTIDSRYNNTEIKFVAGPANSNTTGVLSANNAISFTSPGAGSDPVNITYQLGTGGPTTAVWSGNNCVVTLEIDSAGKSVATASEVIDAINLAPPAGVAASNLGASTGAGIVGPDSTSFNNQTSVAISGSQITVFLERELDEDGGEIIATASDVKNALDSSAAGLMISTTINSGALVTVSPTASAMKMETGVPYTLAHTTISPKGTQNDLVWSVKNNPNAIPPIVGSVGNGFSVEYKVPLNPPVSTPSIEYDAATGKIVVNGAANEEVYHRVFKQVFSDPASGAFQSNEKAHEMALREAITTTANDVKGLVEAHPDLKDIIEVKNSDGNSGEGKINVVPMSHFADGHDKPAMFRVSQDGGKTWGPPMSFGASEYKTGDMFYNAHLGHASVTTGLSGKANDLVFTARNLGTSGNDIRVEYNLPRPPVAETTVTVGPNPWNICVNLATDPSGKVTTTANEVMNAINAHPEASQLVMADLANYHEGGHGVVKAMECISLSVGEPYQINGKTVMSPLGHATAEVLFGYSPPAQSSPNIIFQAINQGPDGNEIGVRYTTSADPTFYSSAQVANNSYQDKTTVRYETGADGKMVLVVHLASEPLPSCPDPDVDREASDKWKELYPLYSCTSARAVTATAGSIIQALTDKNMANPASAFVVASMERWPEGWDSTAKVGPTVGTVWLTGGNETEDASNHGVNLRFIADGTALQVGDIFRVPVGWYRGDEEEMDINASSNYRTTLNIPGSDLLGANGASDNILDTVQRLVWALENNDTALVGRELPKVRAAIEKIATLETTIGTRQIRNQFVERNLDQAKYTAEYTLSIVEDADFAQLITDLKNAQTVYEACLGATGLTNKLSLLNYI
ncbi:MAG: flagellin [Candidatus Adiutrix sp.]